MILDPGLTKDWLSFEEFKTRHVNTPVEEYSNQVMQSIRSPLVSVVIITYQHAQYVQDAIEGVLMQKTDFPFEIIIGDDESTDGTREICVKYAETFPGRIRLFLHRRRNNIKILGKSSGIFQIAYNIFNCRGKYLAITSGDDFWQDDTKLQKQVDFLDMHPNVSCSYHDHVRLFPDTGEMVGPFAVDRIQTVVGRNIFDRLPAEFMGAMQEDSFLTFFWRQIGPARYIEGIKPAVIRFHSNSMYTSLEEDTVYLQKINLWNQVILACRHNKAIEKQATQKLIDTIFYRYWNSKEHSPLLKIKCIYSDLRLQRKLTAGLIHIIRLGLKRIARTSPSMARHLPHRRGESS